MIQRAYECYSVWLGCPIYLANNSKKNPGDEVPTGKRNSNEKEGMKSKMFKSVL